MKTITPIPVAELKPNYYLFGNKGAVWSNTAHISKSGENGTLCGLPMLSSNWARIEEVKEIGCPTCIARYHEEMKTIKAVMELAALLTACDSEDDRPALEKELAELRRKYSVSIGEEANRLYNRILALKDQLAHL